MDNINDQHNTMFTSHTWNLDMPIQEDGLLNDIQPSYDPIWTENYPIDQVQPHQTSSFTHLLTQSMLSENTTNNTLGKDQEDQERLSPMKEMVYKIAAMQPVDIDPAAIPKPTRRNVRISDEPQSVAARLRREKISEKIRILQRLVPGGAKMDTASMLDEAIRYVKFLKRQIRQLQGNQVQQQPCNVGSSWQVQPNISLGHSTASASSTELTPLKPLGHNFILEANWDATANTFPFNNEVTRDN